MRRHSYPLLVAVFAALFLHDALAQYPSRPIRLLVGFPPGGGPDIVARLLAPKLAEALGQPVVVETRVGGTGTIAGEAVAKSPADGHTLLVGHDGLFVINPHLYKEMPIDPLKDLAPVASLVSNGFFLAINPSVPAQTFSEFIEYARRADPPIQYGSGGNGSQHHLTMERLKARAGINMVHVPYKGGAPATTATVAGEVAAMMSGTSTAGQIRAGRLRAIAFTGPQRSRVLPGVPAIAEFYPDFVMGRDRAAANGDEQGTGASRREREALERRRRRALDHGSRGIRGANPQRVRDLWEAGEGSRREDRLI